MSQTYYPQPFDGRTPPKTLTVRELIVHLETFDPDAVVVFRTPEYGAFGPNSMYSIDTTEMVTLEASEEYHPAGFSMDEETGERVPYEEWTDRRNAWTGVVIR